MSIEHNLSLKCATVGIDGTGKSSSLDLAVNELAQSGIDPIAFLGRKPFSIENGKREYHLGFLGILDYLHEVADKTGNKELVLWTNLAHIYTQGRIVEPYMQRVVRPSLVVSPRDYLVDSTVYAGIYWKEMAVRGLDACCNRAAEISGMEPRNLLFFLTAPTEVAMARIQHRLETQDFDKSTHNRPKWAHIHERDEQMLETLRTRYYPVLGYFAQKFGVEIHEVDTTQQDEMGVAQYISEIVFKRIKTPETFQKGEWVKFPK